MTLNIGDLTKVCRETPDVVKIVQKYRAFCIQTWDTSYSWQQCGTFWFSTTVQKEPILAFSIATLNSFILLIATLSSTTIQTERTVVYEQKQSLRERAIVLHQMNEYSFIYFMYHSWMSQTMLRHKCIACLVTLPSESNYYSHINYINPVQSEQRSLPSLYSGRSVILTTSI